MTTVVFANGVMAADRMACEGNNKSGRMTKIFRSRGHLVGFSGSADVSMVLLRWFENGANEEEWPDPHGDDNLESSMLVVTPAGQVLQYERFPIPLIMEHEFHAIGSGRDFALAALHLGCDARAAVELASKLDAYTGGGIDTLSL
jgi:ATP-dependent protease HslVU (ClpYQ) peptidase subunit